MKLDFIKDTKRNVTASAINSFLKLFFPFLNRSLFLWLLGPKYLGLNGLFSSILGVLSLAELGFGNAIHASLYKTVAEDNATLMCAYLQFYRKVYRYVGSVIFIIGLCLMPFLRKLIHGTIPPNLNLYVLYSIHLTNTAASYFFFAYRGCILGANNRKDILSNINTLVTILQYVSVCLVLLLTRNYYYYVLTTVTFTVINNLLIFRESRRLFPGIEPNGQLPDEIRRKVITDVQSIFLHKVGGVISYQMDNIVISACLGLISIAIYGNYYYVITSVCGLVSAFYASMPGGFGNKIHTESKEENFALFMRMCRYTQIIILWCAAMMIALYQPFISFWTKGNPMLLRHFLTPVLMVLYFYINQSRQTLLTFKSAALLWKQDRWKPIVAGVVNLSLNITMVIFLPEQYKLDGVILSTIVGFAFIQIPWETHVVFTHFYNRTQQWQYLEQHASFAVLALMQCFLTWSAANMVTMNRALQRLIVKGIAAAIVSSLLTLLFFYDDIKEFLEKRKEASTSAKQST